MVCCVALLILVLVLCTLYAVFAAAGGYHSCALLSNGGVRCWGGNTYGQLGYNDVTQRNQPATTDINLGVGVTAIAVAGSCFAT